MGNWQKIKEAGQANISRAVKKVKDSEPIKETETGTAEATGAASEEKA